MPGIEFWGASQVVLVVRNLSANAGDVRGTDQEDPGGGNGNPLRYSCLGNPMDRGTWKATLHGVTESQT